MKALINEDVQLAHNICERDDIVDRLRDQICRELITFMMADPTVIEPSMRLIRISRSLERIADLSTNICEDVIYMAEGRMIKNGQTKKL
jgi:phosphate transport system protein